MRRASPTATPPADVADNVAQIPGRTAGTDAERRAAQVVARELRARRRSVQTQTFWVRPAWPVTAAVCAAAGVAASVVSVDHPRTGLGIAIAAVVLLVGDVTGRLPLLRRFTRERATQNVVSPAPVARPVTVLLTAALDAPRRGMLWDLPAQLRWTAGALGIVLLACGVRATGVDERWLGAVELGPTVVLVLTTGLFLDRAAGRPQANAGAVAAVLEIADALAQRPPRRLAVEVLFAGASAAEGLGVRHHLGALRRNGVARDEIVVLEIGPVGGGPARWWRRGGPLWPVALHPQLVAAARQTGAAPIAGATGSAAIAARMRRWPALRIGTADETGDPSSVDAVVDLALDVVARLDAQLMDSDPRPAQDDRPAPKRLWGR